MRINESGVERPATVNAMRELGSQLGGRPRGGVRPHRPPGADGADYPVTMRQSIHEQALAGIAEGGEVVVKIDPDDPQSLLVWGAAG